MKKIGGILVVFLMLSCSKEIPTAFSEAALNDTFLALDGSDITFKDIIEKHKGQAIVIDVWASWCGDCIKGMPKVKVLQQQFPNAAYVFLSLDKKVETWKKGIKHYNIIGDHYYLKSGWDGAFSDFLDLDWIPRYMVIDANGNLKLYEATKANDPAIANALK